MLPEAVLDQERDGALIRLPRCDARRPAVRALSCVPEIWVALGLPQPSGALDTKVRRVRAHLNRFVAGSFLVVRSPPSRSLRADLALLEEAEEDVWEFRCPQVRVFGRFADFELFIGLIMADKVECHTAGHYRAAKDACKRRWASLFPAHAPFRAERPVDYLGNAGPARD